jgi:hypothetical protein
MYQIFPLLLALALLMPWTGPADPGNRMAAANAADGLAIQALAYHQAALAYVTANPAANGPVIPIALSARWSVSGVSSCASRFHGPPGAPLWRQTIEPNRLRAEDHHGRARS